MGFQIRDPGQLGIGTEAEAARLAGLEQKLSVTLESTTRWLGTIRTAGDWSSFYYASAGPDYRTLVDAFMGREAPERPLRGGCCGRSKLELLLRLAATTREIRLWIHTKKTCNALAAQGDALSEARAIEHMIALADAHAANALASEARKLGFRSGDPESDADGVTLLLRREDTPAVETMHRIALELSALAEEHGGTYEGWESALVR